MFRLIENDLLAWKTQINRKPLLIRGARQVGKSYSVEKFGPIEVKSGKTGRLKSLNVFLQEQESYSKKNIGIHISQNPLSFSQFSSYGILTVSFYMIHELSRLVSVQNT